MGAPDPPGWPGSGSSTPPGCHRGRTTPRRSARSPPPIRPDPGSGVGRHSSDQQAGSRWLSRSGRGSSAPASCGVCGADEPRPGRSWTSGCGARRTRRRRLPPACPSGTPAAAHRSRWLARSCGRSRCRCGRSTRRAPGPGSCRREVAGASARGTWPPRGR